MQIITKRFNKTCESSCTTIILNSGVPFFLFVRILKFVLVFRSRKKYKLPFSTQFLVHRLFIYFFLLEHSAIVWVVLKEYHFSIHVFKIRSIDELISAYKQLQVSNDNSARARWLTTVCSIFSAVVLDGSMHFKFHF